MLTPATEIASSLGGAPSYKKYSITYKDLQTLTTASGVAGNLTLQDGNGKSLLILPGGFIMYISVNSPIGLTGGSLGAMTMSLGDGSNATFWTTAANVFANNTTPQETAPMKLGVRTTGKNVVAVFTPTSDTNNNATAGQVDILICYFQPSSTPGSLTQSGV